MFNTKHRNRPGKRRINVPHGLASVSAKQTVFCQCGAVQHSRGAILSLAIRQANPAFQRSLPGDKAAGGSAELYVRRTNECGCSAS
jgi:hypothetical protein